MITKKQKRFCQEYIIDFNATQAAVRAGYSERSARNQSCVLLTKPNIQAYVSGLIKKVSDKAEISAEKVLREYAKLAFTNLTDLVDMSSGEPVFKDLNTIKPEHLAALQSVSQTVTGLKFKMHDKKGALDSLAKHLGMFAADNKKEVELKVGEITMENVQKVKELFEEITE